MTLEELAKERPRLLMGLINDASKVIGLAKNKRINDYLRIAIEDMSMTLSFVNKELDNETPSN